MASTPLLDYVVAHMLCYVEYRDHSTAFWRLVAQFF
ncbi:MAG: M48 family metallopeptidase [Pirellulales bacterium]|nr:M48 family metallopeptidase [Pirellulales bacterium]